MRSVSSSSPFATFLAIFWGKTEEKGQIANISTNIYVHVHVHACTCVYHRLHYSETACVPLVPVFALE